MLTIDVWTQRNRQLSPQRSTQYALDSIEQLLPEVISVIRERSYFVGAYVYDDAGNKIVTISHRVITFH